MNISFRKPFEVPIRSMKRSQKVFKRIARLAPFCLIIAVLVSCASGRIDPTDPVGENAKQIDGIMRLSGYMATAVGVFVAAAVIYVIVKFRARPDDDPDELPVQVHGNRKAELTWTVIPVLMLVFLAIVTIPAVFDLSGKSDGRTIKVEGQQWWWQFSYDVDEDGEYDIVTANEIVIPVNEEINLDIRSNDVIHSFWIPQLNGKRDAVPGRVHSWRISSPVPGIFYGECTEFCGLSHANMQMRAVVLSDSDYATWVDEQLAPSDVPLSEAAKRGYDLFGRHCVSCHVVNGVYESAADGNANLASGYAPNLTHLMTRTSFAGALYELYKDDGSVNVADLREWVRNAPGQKPARPENRQGMISFAETLSATELDDLVTYLLTLGGRPPLMPS
ncbi:MAG TPA: cytochrome c oxidase subunit II [Acidimicrobiaceae bacterium]|jgi:cytochrome c oxidase subunit 2|nr:cytochrome c oxidase subunit II [Acidimicrobiaceae bacterium]|tara:strand:+ start:228 stop:1397 length:1170 start_codon:yes stop_codon:yes gene_type:complete